MRRLYISPRVRLELRDARKWYAAQNVEAPARLTLNVQQAIDFIVSYPLSSPVVLDDIRKKQLMEFPYALFYRVTRGGIFILALGANARGPEFYESLR